MAIARGVLSFAVLVAALHAHAPPTPLPSPPFRVAGNRLVDSKGLPFLIRGVNLPALEAVDSGVFTPHLFRIIQQRWNMNAVRLPAGVAAWKREGAAYLDRLATIAAAANAERLVVILAAYEPAGTGLPTADTLNFWRACAQKFEKVPGVIFSLFHEPTTAAHGPQDWQRWHNAMHPLVDAIRGAGASHLIAAPAFHDGLEFQGFTQAAAIRDPNILYESHPTYDHGLTDEARDANFGFMAANYPVYAGSWGMPFGRDDPACRAIPAGIAAANDLLFQTAAWFDRFAISWTVADFRPGSLIQEFTDATVTQLDAAWTCDASSNPRIGIGQFILLYMTGDVNGFGSLDPALIASAANLFPGPVAPGQILSIYGQLIGPAEPVGARVVAPGLIATQLSELEVFFDGIPAPILLAGAFQVTVQVPYEVAGHKTTVAQLVYRNIPSNRVELAVVDAAPGLFTQPGFTEAAALNQDGSVNGPLNAAPRGSVVSLFGTGFGQTTPPSANGALAGFPLRVVAFPVTALIAARPAEILYAGNAPGMAGVTQINVRVPESVPVEAAALTSVTLTAAGQTSRAVTIWVR